MADLSREEALTLIEVMSKNAVNLEKISSSLEMVVSTMKEVNTCLHNGMAKEIIEAIGKKCDECADSEEKDTKEKLEKLKDIIANQEIIKKSVASVEEIKINTAATKQDIHDTKLFISLVAIAIVVVTSFVNIVIRNASNKNLLHEELKEIHAIIGK